MRSNVGELPGLSRLAARLGATFIIVSNARRHARAARRDPVRPPRQLPRRRRDLRRAGAGGCRRSTGTKSASAPLALTSPVPSWGEPGVHAQPLPVRRRRCVRGGLHGGVSPCPPLLHTYTCFVRGREKRMLRWEVGRLPRPAAGRGVGGAGVRRVPRPGAALRLPAVYRLRRDLAETDEEDCLWTRTRPAATASGRARCPLRWSGSGLAGRQVAGQAVRPLRLTSVSCCRRAPAPALPLRSASAS